MKFQLPIHIPALPQPIRYTDKIMLIGSCFTEHMAGRLAAHKFRTLQNPHGILFNPLSVARSLQSYASGKLYDESELFYLNELWGSWDHHTRFSHIDKAAALGGINGSQKAAADFIREADWIIITLGSAFQYFLTEEALGQTSISKMSFRDGDSEQATAPIAGNSQRGLESLANEHRPDSSTNKDNGPDSSPAKNYAADISAIIRHSREAPVANNHRAPAAWFRKDLLKIPAIIAALKESLRLISHLNPRAQFLFTISPVRHIRDGVTENNRSKARLIEAVHELCATNSACHYFPAYELVIDVLRDYRFYDIDMVHPNYAATEAVWEAFLGSCIAPEALPVMAQVREIVTARSHLPRFPETEAHHRFLKAYAGKVAALAAAHPYLNLADEASYFNAAS